MSKSKFIIDKFAKLFEQGLISYKDLSSEITNILRSQRDDIVFKMKLTSKEETAILFQRIEKIEKKIEKLEKKELYLKVCYQKLILHLKLLRQVLSMFK